MTAAAPAQAWHATPAAEVLQRLDVETAQGLTTPFDSDYKFMATFHRWTDRDYRDVVRCFIKGAPDVLVGRADRFLGGTAHAHRRDRRVVHGGRDIG